MSLIAARSAMVGGGAKGWKNPYVTDGLVAMWDGEWNAGGGVHDPNATVWKDLVGGVEAIAYNGTPIWQADRIVFDKSYYMMAANPAIKNALSADAITLEVCGCYGQNTSVDSLVSINNDTINNGSRPLWQFAINTSQLGATFRQSSGQTFFYDDFGVPHTCSQANRSVYVNGNSKGSVSVSAGGDVGGRVSFGYFVYNKRKCEGFLHSVRCYSRALTADEIGANYAVDRERFNLP